MIRHCSHFSHAQTQTTRLQCGPHESIQHALLSSNPSSRQVAATRGSPPFAAIRDASPPLPSPGPPVALLLEAALLFPLRLAPRLRPSSSRIASLTGQHVSSPSSLPAHPAFPYRQPRPRHRTLRHILPANHYRRPQSSPPTGAANRPVDSSSNRNNKNPRQRNSLLTPPPSSRQSPPPNLPTPSAESFPPFSPSRNPD